MGPTRDTGVPPGRALYDRIGSGYDATRHPDRRIVDRLAHHLRPSRQGRFLDVGCGTGNYTAAVAARGGRWWGLDPSDVMLASARARHPEIGWQRGAAEALPFADASFDGVLCTLAVHHFGDRPRAFREVFRVLGTGRFVLFSCTAERTHRYWLRDYFPEMFRRSEAREPSERELLRDLGDAGFEEVETEPFDVPPDVEDLFLYAGKHRPELYFDPAVRAGISSFANLCRPDELAAGLARLREDLDAGRIPEAGPAGDSPGDYALIVASKSA